MKTFNCVNMAKQISASLLFRYPNHFDISGGFCQQLSQEEDNASSCSLSRAPRFHSLYFSFLRTSTFLTGSSNYALWVCTCKPKTPD